MLEFISCYPNSRTNIDDRLRKEPLVLAHRDEVRWSWGSPIRHDIRSQ